MKFDNNEAFANIIIPKEMVPYESEKSIGIKYYHQVENEWETGLLFISRKFVKQSGSYNYKVGIVKTWTYTAKTAEGKPINIPAEQLIFFLMNDRKKYGGK